MDTIISYGKRAGAIMAILVLCGALTGAGYNYSQLRDQQVHIQKLESTLRDVATREDIENLKEQLVAIQARLANIEAALMRK